MIAQWMLGAIAFSLLCGVAALAAERGLRALGRQTRLVWAAALAIAAMWPVIARVILVPPVDRITGAPATAVVLDVNATVSAANPFFPAAIFARIDDVLLSTWAIATILLLLQLVLAVRTLRRVGRQAQRVNVNGEQVLVDDTLGPAVIGLIAPTIVIPAWLLGMDDALRTLVLRHEREHCRVGDPALVWLSVVATTLLPWNFALWWISQRLRLAMEIDCDARTVATDEDRTRYAKLLLLIAQRKMSARFVPTLSDSQSHLGRRISAMHSEPERRPALRAAVACGVAILAVTGACSSRMVSNLTSPTPASNASTTGTRAEIAAASPGSASSSADDQVPKLLTGTAGLLYPAELRAAKVTGPVVAMYIVNVDGTVDTTSLKVLMSAHPAFTTVVRNALPALRYDPARKAGKAVRGLTQQYFMFDLARDGSATATAPPTPPLPPARPTTTAAPSPQPEGNIYFDFQVEMPVSLLEGSVGPTYPQQLREARVQGVVLAQYVVDVTGRADMTTFKVLKSDHDSFSDAVRTALSEMQFNPALLGGQPVRQLVQQPFQFALDSKPR